MRKQGLYDPQYEHDACGVGLVGHLGGLAEHGIIERGLTILNNLSHRGASGADADSGDGAGLLIGLSDAFLRKALDFPLPPRGRYGLGMIFLPIDQAAADRGRKIVAKVAAISGWRLLGWRAVPVQPEYLGRTALESRPAIWQFVVAPTETRPDDDAEGLERRLYGLRKRIESEAALSAFTPDQFYIVSLSSRTVIYKGMMMANQVAGFYPDLTDPSLISPFALVHQRYSTNTFPSWRLAQPFRTLAHNGEINTIRGNRDWLTAREPSLKSPLFGADLKHLFPLIEPQASDSASLDNAAELLMRGGRTLDHAMAMLIPQAWGDKYPLGPNVRGFFEFHAGLMEPWDGPAAVVFTDGRKIGACLDRNGLRPTRYTLTDDGLISLASEAGVLELPEDQIVAKGALRPGQMILAEIGRGRLIENTELKSRLARSRPYRRWVTDNRIDVPGFFNLNTDFTCGDIPDLLFRQGLFGYTRDDTEITLEAMAVNGLEPTGSMGADTPLPVLSPGPQSLFAYFRQQFAQITNPPIDPIREELVMSLMTFIGYDPNILDENPRQARLVKLKHPILSNADLQRLENLDYDDFRSARLTAVFKRPESETTPGVSLAKALDDLERQAHEAVLAGARIIIISDRGADSLHLPLPSLLAVAAVNRKLLETGHRVGIGVLCETGEARETTHIAMLLSLGASAVNPWLAFETVADLAQSQKLSRPVSATLAVENYVRALSRGLLKIMSKMGISTLRGYRGARIFEAVGLGPELMEKYFPNISSRVGGIGLAGLEKSAVDRWRQARPVAAGNQPPANHDGPHNPQHLGSEPGRATKSALPVGGIYHPRKGGAPHLWTPKTVTLLRAAVRNDDLEKYREYAALMNNQAEQAFTLRGLLGFTPGQPVPLSEVEPAATIRRRFVTGAMSFGSLSREAHEALALAMNSLGGRSNSGEGGEDPKRNHPLPDGGDRRSAIRQVASGRFGVTLEYLLNADELQIKIAQGAKPGEGGQLPGPKVDREIARVRHSTPGVTLISPPPHHDIYSIEDIAQLIYDLRQVNDQAIISVKLASETGIGPVATGVAKAGAGTIVISGADGGTGASPLSSIHQAGSPWEIGLAETQQTLMLNHLRARVRLQVDGQLKTGRDVAVAALLGADEFAFATAPLVALGCVMMRKCHTNGCPVGVATQDPKLRARFAGKPEHLVNYFHFVAEEFREIMASLGFRTVEEMIGRVDRLQALTGSPIVENRGLDFSALLAEPGPGPRRFMNLAYEIKPEALTFDDQVWRDIEEAAKKGVKVDKCYNIRNTTRTAGAKISAQIARIHGAAGLPEHHVTLNLRGTAGQSFGAFAVRGLTLNLAGQANDYVGKGLSGGCLIIRPPAESRFEPARNIIIGNVALYGATSGELYINGQAGERFAVRNSGALAVVEGVGDHACEYMTGGLVVILGTTGVNFGAGMSGGLAYVYDRDGLFDSRCNLEMIDLDLLDENDEIELKNLIETQAHYTGSPLARAIVADWERNKGLFIKVFPQEYRRALGSGQPLDSEPPLRPPQHSQTA